MSAVKNQKLQGKLTYVSLGITALAALFQVWGKSFPEEEVSALVEVATGAWPTLVEAGGLIMAAYGRLRREWRQEDSK